MKGLTEVGGDPAIPADTCKCQLCKSDSAASSEENKGSGHQTVRHRSRDSWPLVLLVTQTERQTDHRQSPTLRLIWTKLSRVPSQDSEIVSPRLEAPPQEAGSRVLLAQCPLLITDLAASELPAPALPLLLPLSPPKVGASGSAKALLRVGVTSPSLVPPYPRPRLPFTLGCP